MHMDSDTAASLRDVLSDVVAIPVTPFAADGHVVDWDSHARLIRRQVDAGIKVLTPNGNTGEFYTLTADEARAATERTVEAADGRAEVLVGVGLDIETAMSAAQHARTAGARMVMVHQPVHPYISAEGWLEYHRRIARAVPELGVVLYVRDARIDGALIGRLADQCPNIVGVKYGVPDTVRFASVARDAGYDRLAWLAGLAELSTPGNWAVGARGFTSGLVNVAPELSLTMLAALRDGDYPAAMKVWEQVRPFEELRAADGSADNVSVVKEALHQLGLCRRDVRPPSRTLPEDVRTQVSAVLASWGLVP